MLKQAASTQCRPRFRSGLGGSDDTGVARSWCQGGGSQLLGTRSPHWDRIDSPLEMLIDNGNGVL